MDAQWRIFWGKNRFIIKWTNNHNQQTGLFLANMLCLLINFLSSCSTPTTELPPSETPKSYEIPTKLSGLTLSPSATSNSRSTPSHSLEHYGTPIVAQSIVEGSSLFQSIDMPVTFETTEVGFPAGFYILIRNVNAENGIEELILASIDSEEQERLLMVNEIFNLEYFFFSMDRAWIVGGYPGSVFRYFFDLTSQKALQFTICHERHPVELSPSGHRLALICSDREMIPSGKIVTEVISLIDETNIHLEIPYNSDTRFASNSIHWISDEKFITHVGPDDEPCLISIPDLGMRCAPALKDKPIRSVSERLLAVERSRGQIWIIEVYHMECFDDNSKCDPIMTFDEDFLGSALLSWAPSKTMLGLVSSAGLGSGPTKIGYYDTDVWEYHPLATISGDYLFVDWCPDSSCILVRENARTTSQIIFMDGYLRQLDLDGSPPKIRCNTIEVDRSIIAIGSII